MFINNDIKMINKILAAIKFLFRKRLFIPEDLLDIKIRDFQYRLTPESVSNYNQVVTNKNGALTDKIRPVFLTKVSWQILEKLDEYLEREIDKKILQTMVHQSEYICFHQKIDTSDELTVKSQFWHAEPHKNGTKLMVRFEYYSKQILVATEFSCGILFGVKYKGDVKSLGEILTTKKVQHPVIWQEEIVVTRKLPFEYAEKAEIDAPIHTNEKFAKSIGLPDIILQGTCTFAKAVETIVAKELDGNTDAVVAVSAKFTGMVVPPNIIKVRLLLKEQSGFYFDVLNEQNQAVIKGGQILLE